MTRRTIRYTGRLAAGLLVALLLSACAVQRIVTRIISDDPASGYGVDRADSIYLSGGQPRTLDPARAYGGPGSIPGHIFSGLVTLATDLTVQPDLAAGWRVDDSGTVYTFYLHPHARFHDGRAVTAADVLFSWERALAPATQSDTALTYLGDIVGAAALAAGASERLAGVTVVDDRTLQVTIDGPKPFFLAKLTFPAAFVVDRESVVRPNWERAPNGSGPFRLLAWEDDELLILARNELYYNAPAQVAHVVYLLGGGLPLSQYELREIDLVGIGGSTLARMTDPNNPFSAELRTTIALCTSYVGLDTTRPPFDDVRVRQAFNYALDKQRLASGLYRDSALPATGVLPPGLPGFTGLPGYPYDPERARALLRDAGYTTLPPLTYTVSGYTDVGAQETALIAQWREVFDVTIEPVLIDPFIYFEELYRGNVGNFFDFGWCADYPDPENFFDPLFLTGASTNIGRFSDPTLDDWLAAARIEPDPTRRLARYAEAEQRLVEQAPVVLLVHDLSSVLVSPRLVGYVHTPISVAQWHRVSLRPLP